MRKIFFILLIMVLNLSCENALMDVYNERWDGDPVTFENADTPGDRVMIKVGNEVVDFRYANNQSSITFPFSPTRSIPVDNDKATLTNKFFMSETEVTNALFAEVLQWARNNGKIAESVGVHNEVSAATVNYGGQQLIDLDNGPTMKISYNTASDTFAVASGYENHPVVLVTWYGAVMFCNWLTEMRDGTADNVVYAGINASWVHTDTTVTATKNGYRLLSSEEWEFAARFIGNTVPTTADLASEYIAQNFNTGDLALTPGYYWTPGYYASGATKDFNDSAETGAVSWYDISGVMPVAQKRSNHLGIYDMSGNVWEICFNQNPATPAERVHRGGCWYELDPVSYQQLGFWSSTLSSTPSPYVGFRIARTQ